MEIREQTSKENEFCKELQELLKKYKATTEITNYSGSIETTIELQSEWSGGDCTRNILRWTQFQLVRDSTNIV